MRSEQEYRLAINQIIHELSSFAEFKNELEELKTAAASNALPFLANQQVQALRKKMLSTYDLLFSGEDSWSFRKTVREIGSVGNSLDAALRILTWYWPETSASSANNADELSYLFTIDNQKVPLTDGYFVEKRELPKILGNPNWVNQFTRKPLRPNDRSYLYFLAEMECYDMPEDNKKLGMIQAGRIFPFLVGGLTFFMSPFTAIPALLVTTVAVLASFALIASRVLVTPGSTYDTAVQFMVGGWGYLVGGLANRWNKTPFFPAPQAYPFDQTDAYRAIATQALLPPLTQDRSVPEINLQAGLGHLIGVLSPNLYDDAYKAQLLKYHRDEIVNVIVKDQAQPHFIKLMNEHIKSPEVYNALMMINLLAYKKARSAANLPEYLTFAGQFFGHTKQHKIEKVNELLRAGVDGDNQKLRNLVTAEGHDAALDLASLGEVLRTVRYTA